MASKKTVHVTKHENGWQSKLSGNTRASKTFGTQKEAIQYGTSQAKKNGTELFIHGENGQIRERNSYGNDPFPPKG